METKKKREFFSFYKSKSVDTKNFLDVSNYDDGLTDQDTTVVELQFDETYKAYTNKGRRNAACEDELKDDFHELKKIIINQIVEVVLFYWRRFCMFLRIRNPMFRVYWLRNTKKIIDCDWKKIWIYIAVSMLSWHIQKIRKETLTGMSWTNIILVTTSTKKRSDRHSICYTGWAIKRY